MRGHKNLASIFVEMGYEGFVFYDLSLRSVFMGVSLIIQFNQVTNHVGLFAVLSLLIGANNARSTCYSRDLTSATAPVRESQTMTADEKATAISVIENAKLSELLDCLKYKKTFQIQEIHFAKNQLKARWSLERNKIASGKSALNQMRDEGLLNEKDFLSLWDSQNQELIRINLHYQKLIERFDSAEVAE
jgi:hypothetical protein